jgi:hypothetical protein
VSFFLAIILSAFVLTVGTLSGVMLSLVVVSIIMLIAVALTLYIRYNLVMYNTDCT